MSKDNVGGAAFPTPNDPMYLGMSLRDYFAALAMQGLLSIEGGTLEKDAEAAYKMADAMIRAREAT